MVIYKANGPFKLKFAIDVSTGLSLNPQRWYIFAKPLGPVSLEYGIEITSSGNENDLDLTSLDLMSLTRTTFTDDM